MTYFLLDDNTIEKSNSILRKINLSDHFNITPVQLTSWEKDILIVEDLFSKANGIILDWRLYEGHQPSGITYSAESLAQHIRFLVNDRQLKRDVPVVLCSANQDFTSFYERDGTGHDLFLKVYKKDDFSGDNENVIEELISLSDAFQLVQEGKYNITNLFQAPQQIHIDSRLEEELRSLIKNNIPHNLVKFILDEVILAPGVLIEEDTLAARLGISKSESSDWAILRDNILKPVFAYKGVLSKGWQRYWAEGFINWWKTTIQEKHPQYFSAGERVEMLKNKTRLSNLVAAKKLPFCLSDEFWAICEATRQPIDPSDGLRIQSNTLRAWQEERYLSLFSILERKNKGFKLNPIEKDRLEYLKKLAKENGQK